MFKESSRNQNINRQIPEPSETGIQKETSFTKENCLCLDNRSRIQVHGIVFQWNQQQILTCGESNGKEILNEIYGNSIKHNLVIRKY